MAPTFPECGRVIPPIPSAQTKGCSECCILILPRYSFVGRHRVKSELMSQFRQRGVLSFLERWKIGAEQMASRYERFLQDRRNAKRRGWVWNLTYEQWWAIWEKSGMYEHRGPGGYVMARIDPEAGYEPNNVEIITAAERFRQTMDAHYGDRMYL